MKGQSRTILFRLQFIMAQLAEKDIVTCDFIARKFEVSRKTIYRDMDLFRNMGAQIETNMDGGLNGFRLVKLNCPFCQHAVASNHFKTSPLNAGQSPDAFQINLQRAKSRDEDREQISDDHEEAS